MRHKEKQRESERETERYKGTQRDTDRKTETERQRDRKISDELNYIYNYICVGQTDRKVMCYSSGSNIKHHNVVVIATGNH